MSVAGAGNASAAHGTSAAARGQLAVLLLASLGRRLGATLGEKLGNPELAANVPSIILCELALRGPLRPRDLMGSTRLSSGGMTKQLDHLEDLGLIQRSFGTLRSDRRASTVTLTPDGARAATLISEAVELHLDEFRSLVAELASLLEP